MDNKKKVAALCKLQMNMFERFALELDGESKEDVLIMSLYIMHKVLKQEITDFNPYLIAGELTKALVAAMDEVTERIALQLKNQDSENETE